MTGVVGRVDLVTAYWVSVLEVGGVFMVFTRFLKAILTDSHFLVPFFVLLAGIGLLVLLH